MKYLSVLFAFLVLQTACSRKNEKAIQVAVPVEPVKVICKVENAPQYVDPRDAVTEWQAAMDNSDFCKFFLSYAPQDRTKVALMTFATIGLSLKPGSEQAKQVFDFLKKNDLDPENKTDQNAKLEKRSEDPEFFVGLMKALKGTQSIKTVKPKNIKIALQSNVAAKADIIWPEAHSPKTESVEIQNVNGSWFIHETATHY